MIQPEIWSGSIYIRISILLENYPPEQPLWHDINKRESKEENYNFKMFFLFQVFRRCPLTILTDCVRVLTEGTVLPI